MGLRRYSLCGTDEACARVMTGQQILDTFEYLYVDIGIGNPFNHDRLSPWKPIHNVIIGEDTTLRTTAFV